MSRRFVDDTIAAMKKIYIADFDSHLNVQNNNTQFTIEYYNAKCLPFLDTVNKIESDGSITTAVYRKVVHSDRYLPFSSHHPIQHKRIVGKALYYRAAHVLMRLIDEKGRIMCLSRYKGTAIRKKCYVVFGKI